MSRHSDGKPYEEEWESYDPKRKKYIAIGELFFCIQYKIHSSHATFL